VPAATCFSTNVPSSESLLTTEDCKIQHTFLHVPVTLNLHHKYLSLKRQNSRLQYTCEQVQYTCEQVQYTREQVQYVLL